MTPHLFDPENEQLLSNPKIQPVFQHRKNIGRGQLLVVIPHVLVGLFFLIIAASQIHEFWLYTHESASTTAEVIDREMQGENKNGKGRDTITKYLLTYRFTKDNRTYTHQQSVNIVLYERYGIGAIVSVTYVASDPKIATITASNELGKYILSTSLLAVIWNGGIGLSIYSFIKEDAAQKKLRSNGRVIIGELVSVALFRKFLLELTVYFEVPQTGEYITEKRRYRYKSNGRELPSIGASVAIFYLDKKTWEVL